MVLLLRKLLKRSVNMNDISNSINGNELVKNTLDEIPAQFLECQLQLDIDKALLP